MPSPLISVIIPAYDMAKYIGDALTSVAAQTHSSWELIVVEDASDDGTKRIVEQFAAEHPDHRIEYHRHETNRGVSATRNTAIGHALGEFLAFLDPDDYWSPNHLAQSMSVLSAQPLGDISATPARNFREGDDTGKMDHFKFSPQDTAYFPSSLCLNNFITLSSTVVRRSILDRVGFFDETPAIQHTEDWDLWLRIAQVGGTFRFCQEATCHYREHDGGASSNPEAGWQRRKALVAKHSQYMAELQLPIMGLVATAASEAHRGVTLLNNNYGIRVMKRLDRLFAFFLGRSN